MKTEHEIKFENNCDDGSDDESDSDSYSDEEWISESELSCIFQPDLEINTYFEDSCIKIKSVLCGSHHSLCITTDGNVECTPWGTGQYIPYKLNINHKIIDGSCGKNHNVLISNENEIIVFGNNEDNQCSAMNNQQQIKSPYILSKNKELCKR
eukprot:418254_1